MGLRGLRNVVSLVHSHWSRNVDETRLSLVKLCLRQQSYAIKNQLWHPKPPTRGFGTQNTPIGCYFACSTLVLYGIRAPKIGPFRAWKPTTLTWGDLGVRCTVWVFTSEAVAGELSQLWHPKPPTRGFGTQNTPIGCYFACSTLVLYGIRAPKIDPFCA